MKFCHEYLVSQGKANSNMHEFKKQLYQIWFTLYRREGVLDSSGFEHVFVGTFLFSFLMFLYIYFNSLKVK